MGSTQSTWDSSPTEEGVLRRLEEFAMSKTFVFLVTLGFFLTITWVKAEADDTPEKEEAPDDTTGDSYVGDPPKDGKVMRPGAVWCTPHPCCCTETCEEKTKEEHEKEETKGGECGKWG